MKLTMHYLWIATACCWLGFPQSGYTAEYAKDIAPLWKRSCVACHNSKKPEGGLNLESSALLLKGSDSGPTLIAGKSGESELVLRLLATDDSAMPPRDNSAGAKPLTPAEIELVKQWIDAGAMPGEDAAPMAISWQPMPGSIRPVYAVDWSADGQFVAAGRGNQVVMYRWPLLASPADAFALVDPEIVAKTGNPSAHLDLVQSLAFSPDGQYLATGGYRSVKLWRREYAPSSWVGLNSSSGLVEAAPSGKYLAVSRADKTIDIVDVAGPKVIVTLPAAAETISAIAWSHDAAYLLVADQSKQLTRWELPPLAAPAGKKPTALTVGVGTAVTALAALDAQRVAVVSGDGELSIWAVEKANAEAAPALVKKELPEPVKNVVGVAAIAGTPPRLVAAQADGQFIALHAEELKKLSTWKSPAPVVRLAASASSAQLASLGADGQIRLWNLADGKEVKAIAPVTAAMRATAQSEKAVARQKAEVERLTAAVKDLEAASQKEQEVVKKVSEEREKAAAAVTAKTAEIDANASAIKESEKGIETAKQMIAEQMKRIEQLTADIEAKKKKDPDLVAAQKTAMEGLQKQDQALAAAKESATRAAATIPAQQSKIEAGKQKLVSLETSSASVLEVQKAKQAEPPVAFHFDESGNSLVVGRQQGSITLIDVAAGRVSSELKSTAPLTQALMLDNRVLSASPQVPLTAWTGQTQWKLERVIGSETDPKSVLSDRVTALAFSPDNAMLAIGSGPASRFGDVKLFRMSDGGLEKDFGEVHSDTVLDIAFSPDGEQLATCGADKLIRVFELASGKQRLSLEGHTHHVLSIAWQDNGRVLASAGADAAVKFWDTITGEQQRTVTGFNKEITSIAFVGQSSQLLAAAADNSLRLVESTNGKTERSFSGANSPLFALCVSADGKQVLAGGQDGRLAIWAIENAKSEKQLD